MMRKQKKEIAYQNKDIASKIFAEQFRGKSLKVYGIDLPRVKQVLPTNLPSIQANELRLDNLFLLENDTFLIIDYESAYRAKNKIKYLNYVLRVLEQYSDEYGLDMHLSVVVIYTADVLECHTKDRLDVGCLQLTIKEAFLAEMDSEKMMENLTEKVKQGVKLSEEELMEYIILPLTYRGMDEKKETIKELFQLAKEIKEEEIQLFLLSGILVFTDKVIDDETAKQIKEWIRMTKVARLFEDEKNEAVEKAVLETARETARETAIVMLKKGYLIEEIVECVQHLTPYEVKRLKKELEN